MNKHIINLLYTHKRYQIRKCDDKPQNQSFPNAVMNFRDTETSSPEILPASAETAWK